MSNATETESDLQRILTSFDNGLNVLNSYEALVQIARETIQRLRALPSDELRRVLETTSTDAWEVSFELKRVLSARAVLFPEARALFVGMLKEYELAPADRRQVEKAIRFWSREKQPTAKFATGGDMFSRQEAWIGIFENELAQLREQAELAGRLIRQPKAQGENAKMTAGPFRLVNSGGFTPAIMGGVADAVGRAAGQMQAKGLGAGCYGDVYVVGRLSKANVVAQYEPATDALFVRASGRKDFEYVRNLIHEIAHRLVTKFLDYDGESAMLQAYRTAERASEDVELPNIGDVLKEKNREFSVTKVSATRIWLREKGNETQVSYVTPEGWMRALHIMNATVPAHGFVTRYAATDPEENFCELMSLWCQDKLPATQEQVLALIVDHLELPIENPTRGAAPFVYTLSNPSFGVAIGGDTFAWRKYVSRTTGVIDPVSEYVRNLKLGIDDPVLREQVVNGLVEEVSSHPEFRGVEAIVAMPRRVPGRPNDLAPLGRLLARRMGVAFAEDWLVREIEPTGGRLVERRVRFTPRMHASTMLVPHPGALRKVLLLDNVLSSGSTLKGALAAIRRDTEAKVVSLAILWSPDFWHIADETPNKRRRRVGGKATSAGARGEL